MKKTALAIAIGIGLSAIGIASAQQTPYYTRQSNVPISSTQLSFGGMSGQGTCSLEINSIGGNLTTVNSGVLNINGGATPPITFYDATGNSLGTSFSTLGNKTAWFPCPNANGVTFALTATLTYTYTFIATSYAWPYGSIVNGAAGASPCPTNQADGGCNVHNFTSDFTKSLALLPTTCAIAATANTINLCLSGSTTLNRYVWIVDTAGNSTAGVGLQIKVGQQSVTPCDTNCVTWTAASAIGSTAANVSCLWGVPAPPGAFGVCGSGPIGIPLPANATTFNLYLVSGATAPSAGTVGWAYATTIGY